MEELKELVKSKSFVINDIIIKNISKLDISLNEFLLILYFINIDNKIDIDKINKVLNISQSDILTIYTSLLNKGLIEVKLNKGNTIEEELILDNFYNKLLLKADFKEKKSDVFSEIEKEFGRTLSPMEYEVINNWIKNNIDESTIREALKEAVLNNVFSIRYIDRILFDWKKKESKITSKREDKKELFDYNWLEDEEE